jgi:hypothetical protein
MSINGRNNKLPVSAGKFSKPLLPAGLSDLPEHHRSPLAVTGKQVKPLDRVSAARPVARAAKRCVLPLLLLLLLLRHREALLKGEAAPEAMLPQPGEMPEINRTGNTDYIF